MEDLEFIKLYGVIIASAALLIAITNLRFNIIKERRTEFRERLLNKLEKIVIFFAFIDFFIKNTKKYGPFPLLTIEDIDSRGDDFYLLFDNLISNKTIELLDFEQLIIVQNLVNYGEFLNIFQLMKKRLMIFTIS
jgi:hypothetical protein